VFFILFVVDRSPTRLKVLEFVTVCTQTALTHEKNKNILRLYSGKQPISSWNCNYFPVTRSAPAHSATHQLVHLED